MHNIKETALLSVVQMILTSKVRSGESKFAFGPFLAIGIAAGALWGNNIAQWYISMLAAPIQQ